MAEAWELIAAMTPQDIMIATFNADLNEAEGLELKGRYPLLKFYPKMDKTGIDYTGDRDLASFQHFLEKNSEAYEAAQIFQEDPE